MNGYVLFGILGVVIFVVLATILAIFGFFFLVALFRDILDNDRKE